MHSSYKAEIVSSSLTTRTKIQKERPVKKFDIDNDIPWDKLTPEQFLDLIDTANWRMFEKVGRKLSLKQLELFAHRNRAYANDTAHRLGMRSQPKIPSSSG